MPPETEHCPGALSHGPGKILIVAGEASGDLHGSSLVRAIHGLRPGIRFYGIGGKHLEDNGVELMARSSDMAVVGLTEVSAKLPFILGTFFRLKRSLDEEKPDLAILIDYPDFNIPLARAAKKRGVKVFYFISPQVWAWRKGRIRSIRKCVDHMAAIFPFEEALYRDAGVQATFVGHPLLDSVKRKYSREEALRTLGLEDRITTVAILPGSRESEVTRLLPVMMGAAEILKQEFVPIQFVLPLADTLKADLVEGIAKGFSVRVHVVRDSIYDVLGISDAAIVTSGTATVETALMETPMVVIYRVSGFTYFIGRLLVDVDHIAMANIIAGKTIVPELIQDDATPERIAKEIARILTNEVERADMKRELKKVRERMGEPGAAKRAARLAIALLGKDRS
jgi:lipid-A-disaccharide synthase